MLALCAGMAVGCGGGAYMSWANRWQGARLNGFACEWVSLGGEGCLLMLLNSPTLTIVYGAGLVSRDSGEYVSEVWQAMSVRGHTCFLLLPCIALRQDPCCLLRG